MTARFLSQAESVLAQGHGRASAPSMAFHRISDLLHHGLYLQPDDGFWIALRFTIRVACCRPSRLGRTLRHPARPHPSVCRLRARVYVDFFMDEILQKRDLENPDKRDFFQLRTGRRASSITSSDLKTLMSRNGSMFGTILCEPDSYAPLKSGRMLVKYAPCQSEKKPRGHRPRLQPLRT